MTQLINREGQRVPSVQFRVRENNDWKTVTSDELFAGKTVVVFSLPGAFTPTCSSTHLPRYNELAPTFSKLGVDEIVCLSVNDGFVMSEWQKDQDAPSVTFIPDGNGEFTEKMGMLVDKASLGFGNVFLYGIAVGPCTSRTFACGSFIGGEPLLADTDALHRHGLTGTAEAV